MTNTQFRPSALLFDLDGTLLDTAPDLAAAVNHARKELLSLAPLPIDIVRAAITKGTYALTTLGTNLKDNDPMFDRFRSAMLAHYLEHVADLTTPFAGVEDLLDCLDEKELDWGVVTNKPTAFAEPLFKLTGLNTRAKCLVCGDSTRQPKPHPAHLLLAAEKVGYVSSQCVYVGDADTDMQASRSAGMYAVAAAWGYIEPAEDISAWPADIIVDTPKELVAWIQNF